MSVHTYPNAGSFTDCRYVAYVYAVRNGSSQADALAFAEWAIDGGWVDNEHVDAAYDRYRCR